jgi:flagellar biosynthesis anti-sigma factor FlgM
METTNIKGLPIAAPQAGESGKAKGPKDILRDGPSKAAPGKAPPAGNFNVELSPKAREMNEAHKKALEIARATPDVREDKVARIKAQVAAGTYQVDGAKVADGMMREAILDHLAETEER